MQAVVATLIVTILVQSAPSQLSLRLLPCSVAGWFRFVLLRVFVCVRLGSRVLRLLGINSTLFLFLFLFLGASTCPIFWMNPARGEFFAPESVDRYVRALCVRVPTGVTQRQLVLCLSRGCLW